MQNQPKPMKPMGRKMLYGEPTVAIKIPQSMVPHVRKMLEERRTLNEKFNEAILPPAAQRIVDVITDALMVPHIALIETFKELPDLQFQKAADGLMRKLGETRSKFWAETQTMLIDAILHDKQEQFPRMEQDPDSVAKLEIADKWEPAKPVGDMVPLDWEPDKK